MAGIGIETAFLILGGIIFIGYFGEILAKRFRIPSALLLLIIGYLLKLSGYVEASSLYGIQELFGTLALIVLLFDGGLSLNLFAVIFKSGRVLLMSGLLTVICMVFCAFFFNFLFGSELIVGAIFGALAGGIGSTTTISILKGLQLPKEISNFLTLESSITDVFSIVITIVLTQALVSGAVDIQIIGQGIMGKFSIGIIIGVVIGILSILVLLRIERGYSYMITFAIMLMLYAITEFLGGSGAIAVLVFGLVFGNEHVISNALHFKNAEKRIISREFQSEISFFIRTFFFVFLGIVVSLGSITNLMYAILLLIALYILRYSSLALSTWKSPLAEYKEILVSINPRGLATAVLATYPLTLVMDAIAKQPSEYLTSVASQLSFFPEMAFYIIVLSIMATTILVPLNRSGKKPEEKKGNNNAVKDKKNKKKKEEIRGKAEKEDIDDKDELERYIEES